MALLSVQHVKKIYATRLGGAKVQALADVDFTVEQGEFTAIMGESGSGKTTLLNILAGLDKPTGGEIFLNMRNICTLGEKEISAFRRDNLGFVFQDFNLLDTFSIQDNIFLPLVLAGKKFDEMQKRLEPIARGLGIVDILQKFPYEVSGGQKQRTAIARAIITNPQLILADEPTGALDSRSAGQILQIFEDINSRGQTILMVTHSIQAASRAGRVLFIKDGQVFHQIYRGDMDGDQMYQKISDTLTVLATSREEGAHTMAKGLYWKLSWGNLRKNYRLTLPYLLSSTGICMMFYMLCALGGGIDKSAMYGGNSVAAMMELGVYVIGIFAVIFLFYTNSFIMKRRKKELGIYNILGMEKRHIARVILAETLLTALATLVLGLGMGILFSKVLFLALQKVLGLTVPIAFLVPPKALAATVILFLAIFFLLLLYNVLQVRLSKPIELLHGGEVGEKEPKAHWLLAVLGVLLLGAGYYLAVTIQSPIEAMMFFFIAVVLVILGTYLLFVTGITALLKLLKKNKRFYYKTRHFTAVSGMLYRMKQNAAGLASICILSTCLLVTVSTTFSLYTGIEDLIHSRYPREYSLIMQNPNDAAIETMHTLAGEEAAKLGVSQENAYEYKVRMWSTARTGTDFHIGDDSYSTTYAIFQACTLEEFNRFSGRQESLEPGQVLLSDPRNSFDSPAISFDGKEFSVKETDYAAEGEMNAVVYEVYTIVFPDEETLLSLLSQEQIGVYRADVPQWYYYFDLSGDDESLQAFSDAMDRHIEEDFPMAGVTFEYLRTDDAFNAREDFLSLYGGLFFLGMFLGLLFLMGTALIIYYKQISEGYEDARRFSIMQKVGMSRQEVKRSIHSQIILVFFLPLLAAILHLVFAFPMLQRIMTLMNMVNYQLVLFSTIGCVAVFALFYFIIYACTARTYYKIVEQG